MSQKSLPASFDSRILVVHDQEVRLVCSRCVACGRRSFPPNVECPYCGGDVDAAELPAVGAVFSHTTLLAQLTVHPVPTTIVQVELADGVLATGPLLEGEPEIGSFARLVPNVIDQADDERGPYTGFAWVREGATTNA